MKKLLLGLILTGNAIAGLSQADCDIATNGLSVAPGAISVGATADFTFSVYNAGSNPACTIPANSVEVVLSLPSDIFGNPTYYQFQSVVSPAGGIGAYFTWTYFPAPLNIVYGINNNPIPNGLGEANVTVRVIGIALTGPGGAITNLNLQQNGGTSNNPGNDVSSAPLIVFSTLPVTLSDFSLTNLGCSTRLSWISDKEENSSVFEIEISNDGRNFTKLASINASGNSASAKSYSYTDISPIDGNNYYRLKMIDLSGQFLYSKTIKTTTKCDRRSIKLHPNPVTVNNNLTVIIDGYSSNLKGELMDVSGKVIRTFSLKNGTNVLPMEMLAQATYMLRVTETSGGASESFKVIVIK